MKGQATTARGERFLERQERHFTTADADHFRWQVAGPGFAPLEAELLAPVARSFATPYLEIGCGEGANFVHVGGRGLRVGVDRFVEKVRFAAGQLADVCLAAADAGALPLRTASMRLVLIRDVLHHVPEPERVVAEAVRVLAPGGRLFVIEPNGQNPLVAAQARLIPAEAGLRTSRREALEALLRTQPLGDVAVTMRQPLPLRRLVLHHRFGLPALGKAALAVRTLAGFEAAAGWLLPRGRWSYIELSARRGSDGS